MKQSKLWMLVAILFICGTGTVKAQYPDPFLTDETRPNGIFFLPGPCENANDSIEGRFYNDWWYYQWGKSVRDDYAVRDDGVELLSDEGEGVFNDIIGLELGEKATEILYLAQAATTDVHVATKMLKNYFQYARPFTFFGEHSISPDRDEEPARKWGYPSGHAARGWMFAYVLSQVAPDRANALAQRAHAYAMNRVIGGHHWKSDIEAGQMLAAVVFASVSASDAYQKQLKKARKEYKRIKRQKGVQNDSARSHTIGQRYDHLGQCLKSLP
jgi:acid phosphatase (class A)